MIKAIRYHLNNIVSVRMKGFKLRELILNLRLRRRIRNWQERVLLDFLIIGEMKAGTSSLYRYLIQHPKIIPPIRKEIGRFFYAKNYNVKKGEPWYRAHFPSQKIRERGCITGEATPNNFFHPLAARRIANFIPNVKLILLLRNPIDRAYSHYHHNLRMCFNEPLSFEDAIKKENERLKGAKDEILRDGGGWGTKKHYRGKSYLARGFYVNSLKVWFDFFPRAQFLILSSKDFSKTPVKVIKRVTKFLDLPEWEPKIKKKYNIGRYPRMNHFTREKLKKFFEPYNKQLNDMLGIDFGWDI